MFVNCPLLFPWFTVLKIRNVLHCICCQLCWPNGAQLQSHSIVYQSDGQNSKTMHWICHHCMAKPMHCFSIVRPKPMHNVTNSLHCSMPKPMRKHTALTCQSYCIINIHVGPKPRGGGGTQIIFWRSVRPEVLNPYPYLRIFFSTKNKNGWINKFFEIFANRDPLRSFFFFFLFFLFFFFTSKAANFTIFSQILWNGTLLCGFFFFFFWPKWDPFGRRIFMH